VKKSLRGLLQEHKVVITGLKKILSSRPTQGEFKELNEVFDASRATIKVVKARLQLYADSDDDDHHFKINIHRNRKGENVLGLI
jgi:hypothetical protein